MTDDVQTDSRCPGLAEVVTTAPTTCSSWQWPSESKIRILRLKALDTYARNCTQQLARSYLATYRWTHDARALPTASPPTTPPPAANRRDPPAATLARTLPVIQPNDAERAFGP